MLLQVIAKIRAGVLEALARQGHEEVQPEWITIVWRATGADDTTADDVSAADADSTAGTESKAAAQQEQGNIEVRLEVPENVEGLSDADADAIAEDLVDAVPAAARFRVLALTPVSLLVPAGFAILVHPCVFMHCAQVASPEVEQQSGYAVQGTPQVTSTNGNAPGSPAALQTAPLLVPFTALCLLVMRLA